MQLFKHILVYQAADGPISASLRIAGRLSRKMQTRVTVVDVREPQPQWWQDILQDQTRFQQRETWQQEDALNQLIEEVDFDGDLRVKILDGRPIEVLVHEALEESYDLILKDTESNTENLFFGSLDLRLLRLAPSAVWIADSSGPTKTRRILAAIDPHVHEDEMSMNERIIRIASLLARHDDAELYLVSAWCMPSASVEHQAHDFRRYIGAKERVRRRAWESVEHVVNSSLLQIPPDRVLFEEGIASDAIATAVLQVQPDLLVMGSVVRKGIPGLFIGNTAEEVSRQVECSILAIKPEDFSFLLP